MRLAEKLDWKGLSKKKCGKPVYVTKRGRGSQDGMQKVLKLWAKCIEVGGDYVEK
jgi:hypothetical protein